MTFQPGQKVRRVNNPAAVGYITGKTRIQYGITCWQVGFPDGASYVPEDQLELAMDPLDPVDLVREGRLAPAKDLGRVLTHARLSGRLAEVLYSLETTDTEFYAYQFKPVLGLLNGVHQGILVADEVGLGKTIEAGLIWTELRTRYDYRRLLVLCPAVLREKWRQELSRRFGVKADICDAAQTLAKLRDAEREGPLAQFAIIASMQGLRPRRGWEDMDGTSVSASVDLARFLSDKAHEETLIDTLVIDEAHHLRNWETATSEIGRLLRATSDHVVLLSATPVHLRSQDLFQLVRLIDEDTFTSAEQLDEIILANAPLVAVRDRIFSGAVTASEVQDMLRGAQRHPILRQSQLLTRLIEEWVSPEALQDKKQCIRIAEMLDRINLLSQVVTRTRKRYVQKDMVIREAIPEAIELSAVERDFYDTVTQIVREYCQKRGGFEGFVLSVPQRQMASSIPAAFMHWKARLDSVAGGSLNDSEDEDNDDLSSAGRSHQTEEIGPLVGELMRRVASIASEETLFEHDSKYGRLREIIQTGRTDDPSMKLVLFTSFRSTLEYLRGRLAGDGIQTFVMHGDTENKQQVIDAFAASPAGGVLLSTEVGSEGVDLQFARVLVNYDLPWNPMRVEQRIGRLDRIGQRAEKIIIWNLFCKDTVDARIYERLYQRLALFEQAVGGLEPILGEAIRKLTTDLMKDQLSPDQEIARIEQTATAIEMTRHQEEQLESEASSLFAFADYIVDKVMAARALGRKISDDDLRSYVLAFLEVHAPGSRCEVATGESGRYELQLAPATKNKLQDFIREKKLSEPTRLGLGSGPVAVRFRNTAVARSNGSEETISQFHPLVKFISHSLRTTEDDLRLAVASKFTGAVDGAAPGDYVFAVERWSVSGIQHSEHLVFEAAHLVTGQLLDAETAETLVGLAGATGRAWSEAPGEIDIERASGLLTDTCLGSLRVRSDEFFESIRLQNEDRASTLTAALLRQVEGQCRRFEEVAQRHEALGRKSLAQATRGKIEKIREKAERRQLDLEERKEVNTESKLFLAGVIRLEAGGERS